VTPRFAGKNVADRRSIHPELVGDFLLGSASDAKAPSRAHFFVIEPGIPVVCAFVGKSVFAQHVVDIVLLRALKQMVEFNALRIVASVQSEKRCFRSRLARIGDILIAPADGKGKAGRLNSTPIFARTKTEFSVAVYRIPIPGPK
jgi:hypothetical protein